MFPFIRGPMVWISLMVFLIGSIFQLFRFYKLSRKVSSYSYIPPPSSPLHKKSRMPSISQIIKNIGQLPKTVYDTHPVTMSISTLFHVCLILVPLFLLGHNDLIVLSLGKSLPSLPEWLSDGLTLIVILCGAYFLTRRIALARMRAISSWTDYLLLAVAITPFLSGFLAYHQVFDYRTMMTIHMISGELMLITIPFTKMVHMFFFFFSRLAIKNEHTLGRGKRVWLS